MNIYTIDFFYDLLFIMFLIGLVVFVSLYFVDAGYGKMRSEKWGPALNNKVGWFLMGEAPIRWWLKRSKMRRIGSSSSSLSSIISSARSFFPSS